jgi:hypothetical protein
VHRSKKYFRDFVRSHVVYACVHAGSKADAAVAANDSRYVEIILHVPCILR